MLLRSLQARSPLFCHSEEGVARRRICRVATFGFSSYPTSTSPRGDERGFLKTAQCAVLPREMSERIRPRERCRTEGDSLTEHGVVLTPCENFHSIARFQRASYRSAVSQREPSAEQQAKPSHKMTWFNKRSNCLHSPQSRFARQLPSHAKGAKVEGCFCGSRSYEVSKRTDTSRTRRLRLLRKEFT